MSEQRRVLSPLERRFKNECRYHLIGDTTVKEAMLKSAMQRVEDFLTSSEPDQRGVMASINLTHVGVPQIDAEKFNQHYTNVDDFLVFIKFEITAAVEELLASNAIGFIQFVQSDESQLSLQLKQISDSRQKRLIEETMIEAFSEIIKLLLIELAPLLVGADHPEAADN